MRKDLKIHNVNFITKSILQYKILKDEAIPKARFKCQRPGSNSNLLFVVDAALGPPSVIGLTGMKVFEKL